jgi:N-acetylmuramoyl-L-alanine amidase
MKRLLLCLVPWMAMLAGATEQAPRPAEVSYSHFGSSRTDFWRIGDDCYASGTAVTAWGWVASLGAEEADIQAEGRRLRVPLRLVNNRKLISLRDAFNQLGASAAWESDTLNVSAMVRFVSLEGSRLLVDGTLALKPKISTLQNPSRIVFDFEGAVLTSSVETRLPANARFGQFRPNVVRVVVESEDFAPVPPAEALQANRWFVYDLANPPQVAPTIAPVIVTPPLQIPPGVPVEAQALAMVTESAQSASLRLRLSRPLQSPPTFRRIDPWTLELSLPNVRYPAGSGGKLGNSVASSTATEGPTQTTLQIRLTRPMGVEFSTAGNDINLVLIKPVGDSRLAGKTIVVDAGHGGTDSGARAGGVNEKDLTLSISRLIAQELAGAGATVIMTRKTDVFIALGERAAIANRNNADLFVSVHINSTAKANSSTGSITFYHKKEPLGMLLAECIQRELAKISGIPSIGTWSDQRIYSSGFAVLRNARMPSVLLELGFINHNRDRARMVQPAYQAAVAKAVLQGLRVYFGDVKAQDEEID